VESAADQDVVLWDAATGKQLHRLGGHNNEGSRLCFSSDGRMLTTGDSFAVHLWEVATGKERGRIQKIGGIQALTLSRDGRTLAVAGRDGTFRLWDLATDTEMRRVPAHPGWISSLAFSSDGVILASGSFDTSILVWDTSDLVQQRARQKTTLTSKELSALWETLASADADKAYRAIWNLSEAPQQVVPYVKEQWRLLTAIKVNHLPRLIADLESGRFSVREQAAKELDKFCGLTEPKRRQVLATLQKVLAGNPTIELRRRLEQVTEKLERGLPNRETLRMLRALEVLERIATPDARQILEFVSKGAAEARLTWEAKESLERLTKRPAARP
jgi:hypothetical protein